MAENYITLRLEQSVFDRLDEHARAIELNMREYVAENGITKTSTAKKKKE